MFRKIIRRLAFCLLLFSVALVIIGVLIVEREPCVKIASAPTPDDVKKTREFVRNVRKTIDPNRQGPEVLISNEDELRAVAKLGSRLIPGLRSEISFDQSSATGNASVPVPFTGESFWINLRASAPEFEGEFALSSVQLGTISLPPDAALEIGRVAANLIVGDDFGDTVLSTASRMKIDGDRVEFDLAMDQIGTNGMIRGIFGALRGSDMPGPQEIEGYYTQIRRAMEQGELPSEGSYLPYLQFTLNAAYDGSKSQGVQNAYTSAILALARVCGARAFTLIVGGLFEDTFEDDRKWKADCDELTLNGRIDSRRHFTTAAAIQAASNRGFSVSVGEFKELYDTLRSGGFDFTDIAANNSGIRMSDTLMAMSIEEWPTAIAEIQSERDVIISYDGVPQIMSGEEFETIYGNVESEKYLAMLNKIEGKIDELMLHKN